jgi:hypothetical protein
MSHFQLSSVYQIDGVGAASGLLLQQDKAALYLISDSSSFLYRYQLATQQLHKISLVDGAVDHIEKKHKYDLEALCLKDQILYLFGSGSTEKRQNLFCYDLSNQQVSGFDLSALYAKFRMQADLAADELNIEGVVYDLNAGEPRWIFLQRGNGANAKNGLFIIASDVLDDHVEVGFTAIQLPQIGTVESSFTDGCLHDGKLYFLAAAEDTTSTYEDGEVLGSLIGCIDLATFTLEGTQQISDQHKFEGLTVVKKTDQQLEFFLFEDNDTAELKSTIYQLNWAF